MEMKKVGMIMNVLMAVTLSFCLSLIGNLTSGHFTVPGFLLSFVVSTVISFIIGFCVPVRKLSESAAKNMKRGSIPARCLESLISDLCYTPLITLSMVFMAWKSATSHGAEMPFLPMFLRSLVISLIAAFIIIYIVTPILLRFAMKKAGVALPGGRPDVPEGKED